ncbi:MAG: ATP-dependent DNA helicase RecG [Clostridia bacterium]|nr:ATP-dependent DNA helicase RecG [Clostridia bacterium]
MTPVQYIKGVGEKRAALLKKLGIESIYDLVHFYPRAYIDFTSLTPICKLISDTVGCFSAVVGYDPAEHQIRKGMTVYKTLVTDGEAGVYITVFNNRFLAEKMKQGEEYVFYGKVTANRGRLEMTNPVIEPFTEEMTMMPVYPLTAGITSNILTKIINNALPIYMEKKERDFLPDKVRQEHSLCHESFALKNIHFPKSKKEYEIARRRLIFEELFILQAGMKMLRKRNRKKTSGKIEKDCSGEFISSLPFTLTGAQQRVIREAVSDMKKDIPMNRLVQGDVGSGKTAVACCLTYVAAKNGLQSAFMAPTEILARQHFETVKKLTESTGIKVDLLVGSLTPKKKKEVKERLASGETDIIIGTHALLTEDTVFSCLGLIVTDEQHRFGVNQRGSLSHKGSSPHTLVMSATPIPRTLSLIIYGDLDLSVIDELPGGRQKISTYRVDTSYRQRLYAFIKKHMDMGLQAYIVCPAVEEGDSELTAATEYAEMLKTDIFKDYSVGLLHGKMKAKEKERVMESFSKGETGLLVATTVIEVGVDVPNAVIMVIENAERFGLSQLHQLRGRVGRGSEKSYCVLVSDAENETAGARLDIMCRTADGFKIADKDLELRGPGDFFGSRQHGLPDLKIADLTENMDIVRESRQACENLFRDDPSLSKEENKGVRQGISRLFASQKYITFN